MGEAKLRGGMEDFVRFLTKQTTGHGRCIYAAIYSKDSFECLAGEPQSPQPVSADEIRVINRAFLDPTMLFSTGVILRGVKFTFLKVENDAILARTSDLSCIVWKTLKAFIVAVFPCEETFKPVFGNCEKVATMLKQKNM